jgi:hypothetical protein
LFEQLQRHMQEILAQHEAKTAAPSAAPRTGPPPAPAQAGTDARPAMQGAGGVGDALKEQLGALGGMGAAAEGGADPALEEKRRDLEAKIAANDALGGKFSLVDAPGPADAPNAVTREEYEKVLKQYADISLGKGDLVLDTAGMNDEEAGKFKQGALGDIGSILQTKEGRDMLARLGDNPALDPAQRPILDASGNAVHRKTTIGQSYEYELTQTEDGRTIRARDEQGNPRKKLDDAGKPIPSTETAHADYADPDNYPHAQQFGDGSRSWGMGSDVVYSPGVPNNGFRSDVTLFHELRHAVDMTQGNMDVDLVAASSPVAADRGDTLSFEHQAIGLGEFAHEPWNENSYRRARSKIGAARAPGALPGDLGMPQRKSYEETPQP